MFKKGKRVLALAAETTPGTAVTPGSSSADWQGRDVDWPNPIVEFEEDRVASGDHGENEAIGGVQTLEFSAKWALKGSSAVNVAPDWTVPAAGCGLRRTAHGSTGQSWAMHTDSEISTVTAYGLHMEAGANPQQLAIQARGCMGAPKLVCPGRGKPVMFETSWKGCWFADADIVTGSRILLNAPSAQTPAKFLGNTVTVHGVTYRADSFTMDWGAVVEPVPDSGNSTGNLHYYLSDWKPRLTLAIELPRVSIDNWHDKLVNEAVGVVVVNIGTNWSLTIPRAQAVKRTVKDLGGVEYLEVEFRCLRNSGADATMDDQVACELLYGAKA